MPAAPVLRRDAPGAPLASGMGYQPALDGLRAVSVIAVICYHAGFGWMTGGFFGVEVFFVISGYLITVLLIEEHARSGSISLRGFWTRRARRLLPALAAVLVVTSAWAALFGSAEQAAQMRHDLLWAVGYMANWGQIASGTPYFAAGSPALLRHLWSLAVEEQWYLLWPLAFGLLVRRPGVRRRRIVTILAGVAAVALAGAWWVRHGMWPFSSARWTTDDLVNIAYLSTPTRAGGLLLGAALAFAWQPWRTLPAGRWSGPVARFATRSKVADRLAATAGIGLLACFVAAHLRAGVVYPWLLGAVSVLSAVLIAVIVVPGDHRARRWLSVPPLVGIGRRSYGLYLWHWPVFVVLGATHGSWSRTIVAITLAAVLTELSYRLIEARFRGRATEPRRVLMPRMASLALGAAVAVGIGSYYAAGVEPFDPAAGGDDATFELDELSLSPTLPPVATTVAPPPTAPASVATTIAATPNASPAPTAPPTAPPTTPAPTTAPRPPIPLPVRLGIVGDSQAHSLAINLPDGIEDYFRVDDGSIDGCGLIDRGEVRSARESFSSEFARCGGWQDRWASTAADNDIVLVVIGAWEVFDVAIDDRIVAFGSREHDAMLTTALGDGLDRIAAEGAIPVVLEVACMRPVDTKGSGVPALPERADDTRTRRLNGLLREVVDTHPGTVFATGPDWCGEPEIANDLDYRWDGVHVYRRGANYIYEAVAPQLLRLAGAV